MDVEQFERAVAGGRLEEAVQLYAGELLEGRYDEWLADERERLAGLHADALERLARLQEHDRRWPEAIRCAERLVALDPLCEESHRLLIELCQASGERARAVRAYQPAPLCWTRAGDRALPWNARRLRIAHRRPAGRRHRTEGAPASLAAKTGSGTKAPSMSPFVGHAGE